MGRSCTARQPTEPTHPPADSGRGTGVTVPSVPEPTAFTHPGEDDVRAAPSPTSPTACRSPSPPWPAWPTTTGGAWADDGAGVFARDRSRAVGTASAPTPSASSPRPLRAGWRPPPPAPTSSNGSPRWPRSSSEDRARPPAAGTDPDRPVAFLCAEFAVHASLPIYSGGLGVLAGDILKEASDLALPMVGGRAAVPHAATSTSASTPAATSTSTGSTPTRNDCPACPSPTARGAPARRAGPGRRRGRRGPGLARRRRPGAPVPARHRLPGELAPSAAGSRRGSTRASARSAWPSTRVLGYRRRPGARALGIDPSVFHLNEGHPRSRMAELMADARAPGPSLRRRLGRSRVRELVFTTHTPVAAGNETYDAGRGPRRCSARSPRRPAIRERFLGSGRVDPDDSGRAARA